MEKINGQYPNVPQHLTDFIKDKEKLKSYHPALAEIPEEVLQHFAVDCVVTNHTHYNHIFKNCCCICDKELTDSEIKSIDVTDVIITCDKHRGSKNCFQIDKERERLGFTKRDYV